MRLVFDGRLFTRKAVDAAAVAYVEWARIKIEEKPGSIQVELSPLEGRLDQAFADEFANYVLGEMRP